MMRSIALLLVALPAVAAGQQADSSARMLISSRGVGLADSAARPATASGAVDSATSAVDSVFLRAQQMVANGQGDAGRALVQAQLDSAPIGSPRYVTALYWRAVVAATAAGAERDLRSIVIEYPLSPESGDALMRLAQLEMARGDQQQALEHLDRLLLEHPENPSRGRAAFWMGQLLFEKGQTAAACARLGQAATATSAGDVELRNQIAYYQQRCVGVDTSAAARADTGRRTPSTPDSVPAPAPAPKRAPEAAPSSVPPTAAPKSPVHAPKSPAHREPPAHRADTSTTPMYASAPSAAVPESTTRAHPTTSRSTVERSAPGHPAPARQPAARPSHAASSHDARTGRYTIQIAAFTSRDAAERLREGLGSRGFQARVVPGGKYFRVRIGRYATRRDAVDAVKALRARHIDGMVTDAERR